MKTLLRVILIAAAIIFVTGCIEEKNGYYVNPDGSGKVVHEVTSMQDIIDFMGDSADEPDPEQMMKEMTQEILQNSKGIETWSDIQTHVTEEGKIYFKGTGYFKDIQNVSFSQEGVSQNPNFAASVSADGLLTVEMQEDEDKEASSQDAIKDYSPEELKKKMLQERVKYNQMKPMVEQILEKMKQTYVVHYAGTLKESVNFETGINSVSLTLEGKKMMAYADSFMADDAKLAEMIKAGMNMQTGFDNEEFYAALWGQPRMPKALIQLKRPMFDYEKEAAQAKAKYPEMIKSLNLTTAAQVTIRQAVAAGGTEIQDLRVGGVRLIHFEDETIDYRPFYQFKGYQMSLVGHLPVENLQIQEGTLTRVMTLGGQSLLPEKQFDRSLSAVKVADDGIAISFEIKMELPEQEHKGLAEIAGSFKAFKSEGIKTIDLGLMELKEGSGNEAEGISIQRAGKMDWGDDYEIELKLKILKHLLKDVRLYREDETEIETSSGSSMSSNNFLMSKSIRIKELPEKGRIVLELYDNLEEYNISFSLKNISLVGLPLD